MTRALLLALLAAPLLTAQSAPRPFTVQETGKGYYRLQDAVDSIGDRDGTVVVAPGRYGDCAIVEKGRVAFTAQQAGTATFDGGACEGKATLVLRGRAAAVDGLIFQNVHVSDVNGAGIRLEQGPLTVTNAIFRDSDEGILTADDPKSEITVDRSTFSKLGSCEGGGGCAHGLYIGGYGGLTVTNSRFDKGAGGHYLKSRAARILVTGSSFDDTAGHGTNYMIDLPAGATGTITGNEFVMGPDKENHSAVIAVAAETRDNPSAGLSVSGNRASLAPGVGYGTTFLADWSHEPLKLGANTLGKGIKPFEVRN